MVEAVATMTGTTGADGLREVVELRTGKAVGVDSLPGWADMTVGADPRAEQVVRLEDG